MLKNPARALAPIVVLTCAVGIWIGTLQTGTSTATVPAIKTPIANSIPPGTQVPQSLPQPQTNANIGPGPTAASTRRLPVTQDPVELWKNVQHGNTQAEVELAIMYLDGRRVTQSCEQAHQLLLAAGKKQSAKSRDLLSRMYAQRCQ